MAELNWTDAQWQKVNNAVTEAFNKSSIASAFLPCYGPLPESVQNVQDENLTATVTAGTSVTVTVSDDTTLKLFNLRVFVELSNEQVADESLSSALLAFRRAANTLAQVEDDIVFNGYDDAQALAAGENRTKAKALLAGFPPQLLPEVVGNQPKALIGLVHVDPTGTVGTLPQIQACAAKRGRAQKPGEHVVGEVAQAVVKLEAAFHPGPFACVLDADLFKAVHTPDRGLLPADSIRPLLNGPLLRSGRMLANSGIVVSLANTDIDIVVGTPPTVQFLQLDASAKYHFRVYEKFISRIKDKTAVQGIGA